MCVLIYWKCLAENAGSGISESMPSDTPRLGLGYNLKILRVLIYLFKTHLTLRPWKSIRKEKRKKTDDGY